MKASARHLLPLYFVFLAITLINGLFKPFDILESASSSSLQVVLSLTIVILYFLMMFGVLAGTVIVLIQRFYKNLFGDEAYLTFTLPVKAWQHVLSKLILAIIWIAISIIVCIISFSIIIRVNIATLLTDFSLFWNEIEVLFGSNVNLILPIYLIISLILMVLLVYNSITIGQQFQNHKILASFITFLVFYFITQIILLIALVTYFLITYGSFGNIPSNANTIPNASLLLGGVSLVLIILALGHYLSINYLLNNKLNLE